MLKSALAGRLRAVSIVGAGVVGLILIAAVSVSLALQPASDLPAEVVQAVKRQPGLIVYFPCGDGRALPALHASANHIVHGLDPSAEKVAEAREYLQAKGLCGPMAVEWLKGNTLPYADNTVNVLVAAERGAVPRKEILRVLAPGGRAFVKRPSGWQMLTKARPANTDDWPQYLHDASGNPVSRDEVVGPPRRLQWTAMPRHARSHEHTPSEMAVVDAGGRLFYLADEGPRSDVAQPARWYLVARDAYNGTLLWQRRIEKFYPHLLIWSSAPVWLQRRVVAGEDRVYATLGYHAPVSELDAATGRTLCKLQGTDGAEEIVLHKGVLLVAVRKVTPERAAELEKIHKLAHQKNSPLNKRETAQQYTREFLKEEWKAPRSIVAIEAASGKVLWRKDGNKASGLRPLSLCAEGDRVFYQRGADISCVELQTGKELWSKQAPKLWVASEGRLICASKTQVVALSQADGKVLWQQKPLLVSIRDVFVIKGSVWLGGFKPVKDKRGPVWGPYYVSQRDLQTGELLQHIEPPNPGHHHRCYSNKATVNYILGGRRGTEFIDLASGEVLWNSWARGVCRYGVMPANGLLYVPPHACGCYITAQLVGFNALASGEPGPVRWQGDEEALDRGPAYGSAVSARPSAKPDDWPTYRHDMARSGHTAAQVPQRLRVLWGAPLGGELTQPTVAGGRVFVAVKDRQQVVALSAATGRRLWAFTAGGRVDTPPTVYGNLVLFGSHDGNVYAVRASDGKLAWRLRAAPEEKLIGADGQVESVWPTSGSVLVRGDEAYVLAGRSSYLDGGMSLLRLDPRTGQVKSAATIYSPDPKTGKQPEQYGPWGLPGSRADVLTADQDYVYLRHLAFDRQGKQQAKPKEHLFTLTDFTEDLWPHRSYWIFGTNYSISIGCMGRKKNLLYARLFTFDDKTLYGYGRSNVHWSNMLQDAAYRLFAADRQTRKIRWQHDMPIHVRAMALAGDKLVLVGPPVTSPHQRWFLGLDGPGKLIVLSAADGTKTAEVELAAEPGFDGVAVAEGKVFVAMSNQALVCLGE